MRKDKQEIIDKVLAVRNKILNYYPFKEEGDDLVCNLSDSSQLIFKCSYKYGYVDLLQIQIRFGIEDTKTLRTSFSFDNIEDKQLLNDLMKNR